MFDGLQDYSSFLCGGRYGRQPTQVVVLAQEVSPTRDIYLLRRLSKSALPVTYWMLGEPCPVSLDGAFVIVVRYVDSRSITAIERAGEKLAGVAWLLDDDVAAAIGDGSLPFHYRAFMAHFWLRFAARLARVTSEIWTASDALGTRLTASGPVYRIDPQPEYFPLPREREEEEGNGTVRIFYHGQKTHGPERRWLSGIVKVLHDRYPQAHFELVGGREVQKLYGKLERVIVRPAFTWPDYLARSRSVRFDIGLAPLLATPFNRARSWVKYLDIARFGAIGVYAAGPPYDLVVRDGENGRLCPSEKPESWILALAELIEDKDLRKQLVQGVDWPRYVSTPPAFQMLSLQESRD